MNDQQQPNYCTFQPFAKIPRLSRDIIVTEKIDGTNAQILITPIIEDNQHDLVVAHKPLETGGGLAMLVGSRTRWIRAKRPGEKGDPDNYGFAAWCKANAEELFKLGPGRHFGEWWGKGINAGYGLAERRFSLFNVSRWLPRPCGLVGTFEVPKDPALALEVTHGPACCHVVPVLYRGPFSETAIAACLSALRDMGSVAAPGFMKPEGIIIFHTAQGNLFKKTILNDASPKGVPGLTDPRLLAAGVEAAKHVFNDKLADYTQNQ